MRWLAPTVGWRTFARRHVGWLIGCAVLLAGAAAVAPFDVHVQQAIQKAGAGLSVPFEVPALLGRAYGVVFLALVLGALGLRREGVQVLIALAVVMVVAVSLKGVVGRVRPSGSPYSFPSGDTAVAAVLILPLLARGWWTAPWTVSALVIVAVRRVLCNAHWPSDVLAGAAVGLAASLIAKALVRPRWRGLRRAWWLLAACAMASVAGTGLLGRGQEARVFLWAFGPVCVLGVGARWVTTLRRRARMRRGPRPAGRRPTLARPAWLAVAAVVVLTWLATTPSLWDRDEPRYVKATMEMQASGQWVVPTFNGEWRLHKPAGIYWLMAASSMVFGRAEWAFRLPAILATGVSVLLIWHIGRRLLGRRAGLWAAVVFLTCPMTLVVGAMATTDAVLLMTILCAMACFVEDLARGARWWRTVALGLATGASMLIKGPMGPALLGPAILGSLLLTRKGRRPGWPYAGHLAVAAVLAVGVFAVWAVQANQATGGAFWRVGFGEHVVQRGLEAREGHGGSFWANLPYYLPVVVVGLFPWIWLLPAGAVSIGRGRLGGPVARGVLAAWCLPFFVLMSVAATKLPHYIMPIFPALALAVGGILARRHRLGRRERTWARRGWWLFAAVALGLGLGAIGATIAATYRWDLPGWPLPSAGMGAGLVLVSLPLLVRRRARGRAVARPGVLVAAMVLLAGLAGVRMLAILETLKPVRGFSRNINKRVGRDVPVYTCGFHEPSLQAYLGRTPVRTMTLRRIHAWAAAGEDGVLVITERALNVLRQTRPERLPVRTVARAEGLNISKGKWVHLHALVAAARRPQPATGPAEQAGRPRARPSVAPAP